MLCANFQLCNTNIEIPILRHKLEILIKFGQTFLNSGELRMRNTMIHVQTLDCINTGRAAVHEIIK